MGRGRHVEAWCRPMPVPAVYFQDICKRRFVWKGKSSAYGEFVRLGLAKVKLRKEFMG